MFCQHTTVKQNQKVHHSLAMSRRKKKRKKENKVLPFSIGLQCRCPQLLTQFNGIALERWFSNF